MTSSQKEVGDMSVEVNDATLEHEVAGSSDPAEARWAPVEACTLPTAEVPLRLAEFDTLFASSLRGVDRPEPGWLRLHLAAAQGVEATARELTARESACCSFFDFDVHPGQSGEVIVDVRVPDARVGVLDGLAARAETRGTQSPRLILD